MPLLLPSESSIVKPFASSFDAPVTVKFWVTVPPPGGETIAEGGDADGAVAIRVRGSGGVAAGRNKDCVDAVLRWPRPRSHCSNVTVTPGTGALVWDEVIVPVTVPHKPAAETQDGNL